MNKKDVPQPESGEGGGGDPAIQRLPFASSPKFAHCTSVSLGVTGPCNDTLTLVLVLI